MKRIAVSIGVDSTEEALKEMQKAFDLKVDFVEFRIDYIPKSKLDLKELIRFSRLPCIITNRSKLEGGRFEGSEEERIKLLQEAADLKPDYLDVELKTLEKYNLRIQHPTQLIGSYHNFQETPLNLEDTLDRMVDAGVNIAKFATMIRTPKDCIKIFNLIDKAIQLGKDVIGIGMGEQGRIVRVYAPILGAYLTFATMDKTKATAPGQLTVEELREEWKKY